MNEAINNLIHDVEALKARVAKLESPVALKPALKRVPKSASTEPDEEPVDDDAEEVLPVAPIENE